MTRRCNCCCGLKGEGGGRHGKENTEYSQHIPNDGSSTTTTTICLLIFPQMRKCARRTHSPTCILFKQQKRNTTIYAIHNIREAKQLNKQRNNASIKSHIAAHLEHLRPGGGFGGWIWSNRTEQLFLYATLVSRRIYIIAPFTHTSKWIYLDHIHNIVSSKTSRKMVLRVCLARVFN